MSNPYIKESGWPYESGLFWETEDSPCQFYVDAAHGTIIYEANPRGLHSALVNCIDTSYQDEDNDDAEISNAYKAEIVDVYLMAVEENRKRC